MKFTFLANNIDKMFRPIKFGKMLLLFYFIIASLGLVYLNLFLKKTEEQRRAKDLLIIHWPPIDSSIACHSSIEEDALQSVEDPSFQPKSKSIFFHETSCRGGLDSRQACSVESAARAHPDWDVHLLFNSPVKNIIVKKSCIAKLLEYPNVKLARVHAFNFSKNTPVHSIVTQKLWKSLYPIEHTADIMRMLNLNKWGGVYLDLDLIVIRPFDSLPHNWIVKGTATEFATGVMAFSKDAIGQNVTNLVLKEIVETFDRYKPKSWSRIGPSALENVMLRICNNTDLLQGNCGGVRVFSHELFYPINYAWAHSYFHEDAIVTTSQLYTHHVWNSLTKMYDVRTNSLYANLAKKYCPKIYYMHGKDFGV